MTRPICPTPPPSPEEIRAARGEMTQVEFGKAVGVTSMAVSFWERGTRRPRGRTLVRLLAWMAGDRK